MTTYAHSPVTARLTACALLLLVGVAQATPRETVGQLAALIDSDYTDASRARAIAAALRAAARDGRFDHLNPRELASALTLQLQPLDHHFRLLWTPPDAAGATTGAAAALAVRGEDGDAYGFRRVARLPGDVGYLELSYFADLSKRAADPARAAADAALQLLAGATAVILDLRDNIGGSTDMASYLVSAFVAPSADIYDVVHWRNGTESERPVIGYSHPNLRVPLYVLISARTASAAEAAAYTLQAAHRAVIVGEVSAGAANTGGYFPLPGGFAAFVPLGSPINPLTGGNWEGRGVLPDRAIASEHALPYAQQLALSAALAVQPGAPRAAYLRLVLQAMRAEQAPPPGAPLQGYARRYQGAVVTVAHGGLLLRRGRQPAIPLRRLHDDVFFDPDEPARRVEFGRDAAGQLSGLQIVYPNGRSLWFPAHELNIPALPLGAAAASSGDRDSPSRAGPVTGSPADGP